MTAEPNEPVAPPAEGARAVAPSEDPGGRIADLALALLVIALRGLLPHAPLDDSFLLLAVVRNALAGAGPHLLPAGGDAALSTLAWPALVALPAWAGATLPQALAAVGAIAEIVAALAVRRLALALTGAPAAAALAAALFATQPVYLLSSLGGMETPLYCAALALAALASVRGRGRLFALAVGLVAWTRVEGPALAALLLALEALRRLRVRGPMTPVGAGALLTSAAPVAHRLLFGEWLPATLAAKAAAGPPSLAGAGSVALEMARAPLGMSAYWLVTPSVHAAFAALALVGAYRCLRDPGLAWRAAPAWAPGLAHAAIFVAAGRSYATNFPWYFAPPLVAVAALTAIGARAPIERPRRGREGCGRRSRRRWSWSARSSPRRRSRRRSDG